MKGGGPTGQRLNKNEKRKRDYGNHDEGAAWPGQTEGANGSHGQKDSVWHTQAACTGRRQCQRRDRHTRGRLLDGTCQGKEKVP